MIVAYILLQVFGFWWGPLAYEAEASKPSYSGSDAIAVMAITVPDDGNSNAKERVTVATRSA